MRDDRERFDAIVVGSGLAGLTFALGAATYGRVAVLTKGELTDSNTSWAQGGIAAAVGEADSWELHERDTLIAGAGLCDENAVRFLVQNAPRAIEWLQSLGARFDFAGSDLALGLEGGHSRNRIVHHADKTGWEVERAVSTAVRHSNKISVFEDTFATRLLIEDGRCIGVQAHVDGLGEKVFTANSVMLATGGCGKMYQHTTNPRVATADGISLAASVGAKIANMEFMQFHPTTLFHNQDRSFLISEAVRGEGGTLRNHLGRRFMYDYDERLELAPRDIVARSIEAELKKHQTWCVYLDTTHLPPQEIKHDFPTIYERLFSIGIEMEKDWIPVVPAQHYSCGGVVTDLHGKTSVPGLYAAGEVSCTGVHGANRLASNSLLEAMVFSMSAAEAAREECADGFADLKPIHAISEAESIRIRRTLQRTMTESLGIVRSFSGIAQAAKTIETLKKDFDRAPEAPYSQYALEARNLLDAAALVIAGAASRKENVGLHFNSDLVN